MDYGHDLRFGSFITPANAAPQQVVAVAQAAEEAGLDLATAGGIGFLAREHGLTIDHIRAVEMVLADGSVVRADAHRHPDLFWGVRGAGSALGVVTSFEFAADEVGDLGFAHLTFDASDTAGLLRAYDDRALFAASS